MVNMKNLKRKAAIIKVCQVGKLKVADISHYSTGILVIWLRAKGWIYQNHKWVKKYNPTEIVLAISELKVA